MKGIGRSESVGRASDSTYGGLRGDGSRRVECREPVGFVSFARRAEN